VLKVACFTGGHNVPSARFRIRQYIERLHDYGIKVTEFPATLGTYPPKMHIARPLWAIGTLASRIPSILKSYSYDLTFLQREMLSTFETLEPLTKRPRVLDVDDAIWLHRRGQFAARLAGRCEGIICGNTFLTEQFRQWGPRVTMIPTGVDTDKFVQGRPAEKPIIGWSGMSAGFKYLYRIEPALSQVLKNIPDSKLRVVSDSFPSFQEIPGSKVEFVRWTPENEVSAIHGMSVGIMPLDDSSWEQGKCSFKMLTYMACGIPVVVSPVGMNIEVLSHGRIGFGAKTTDDWVNALQSLLEDMGQRIEMGGNGRQTVLQNYSVDVVAPKLAETLRQFAEAY